MSRKELFRRMRKSKFFIIGLLIVLFLVLLAVFGPMLTPYNPTKVNLRERLISPKWLADGLSGHIFGTDGVGQDILSRLMSGARISLLVAFFGVAIPCVIGVTLGLLAGYYGGKLDMLVMRAIDVQLSMPQTLLAIAVMAVLGASVGNLLLVVTITGWPGHARMARATVLKMRDSEFIKASRVLGASDRHIIFTQILPNCLTPLIILFSQQLGQVILMEASLSFLGCGVPPTVPTWGMMISDGRTYITNAPWTVVVPGMALMLTVLGFNFLGDGIRDVLDPKNKD